MPILEREPDVYPLDLLAIDALGRESDRRWWVMYTRSNREKHLMRRLPSLNVWHYAPVVPKKTHIRGAGRTKTSYTLLFPGYVFVYGDFDARLRALTTNCISRTIEAPNGIELTNDLRQVHQLIASGLPVAPEGRLQLGTSVRIKTGVFAGLEGTLVRREKGARFVVAVNFLQRGASVVLDDCHVEPLH